MDIVKCEWTNQHGVCFITWLLAVPGAPPFLYGRGHIESWRELDRCSVPEELRQAGQAGLRKAKISMSMRSKRERDIPATEFVRRMVASG